MIGFSFLLQYSQHSDILIKAGENNLPGFLRIRVTTYDDIKRLVAKEQKRKEQVREACKRWRNKCIEDGNYKEKKLEYRERYEKKKLEKPGE